MNYFESEVERLESERAKSIRLIKESTEVLMAARKQMNRERTLAILGMIVLIILYLTK